VVYNFSLQASLCLGLDELERGVVFFIVFFRRQRKQISWSVVGIIAIFVMDVMVFWYNSSMIIHPYQTGQAYGSYGSMTPTSQFSLNE
jgi:hypothetical protein